MGYKAHLALDADSRILTQGETTPANVHEGRKLHEVMEKNTRRVTADKAYDSGIRSAIVLKKNRLGHPLGGRRSNRWIRDDQRKRRRIEPKMAELKHLHGLARARYWTLPKMKIQLHLAVIAATVKRIAKLLSAGANSRPRKTYIEVSILRQRNILTLKLTRFISKRTISPGGYFSAAS